MKKVTVEDLQGITYKDLAVDSPEFRASLSEPFAQIVRDGLNEESLTRKVLKVVSYESNPQAYEEDPRKAHGVHPIQKCGSTPAFALELYNNELIRYATFPVVDFTDMVSPDKRDISVIQIPLEVKRALIKQENNNLLKLLKDGTGPLTELSAEYEIGFTSYKSCIMNKNTQSKINWGLPENIYFADECEEDMIYLLGTPEETGELRMGFDVMCFSESSVTKLRVGWVFAEGLLYNLNFCSQLNYMDVSDITYLPPGNNARIYSQIRGAGKIKII